MDRDANTAELVARLFGNDGAALSVASTPRAAALLSRLGIRGRLPVDGDCQVSLLWVLDAIPADRYTDGFDNRRWEFRDGSVISLSGHAWDVGFPGCYCWVGAGHTGECLASSEVEDDDESEDDDL